MQELSQQTIDNGSNSFEFIGNLFFIEICISIDNPWY